MKNKIFEQIALQAGGSFYPAVGGDLLEKFAELLVKECIQTLHNHTPVLDDTVTPEDYNKGYVRAVADCQWYIEEHFGVKR